MVTAVLAIFAVLFLFGLTVFVHELGHFLLARLCGMKVDVFSIGFGPALWKRERNGIVFKIGAFPFGGYVALPQMNPVPNEPGPNEKSEPVEGQETAKNTTAGLNTEEADSKPLPPAAPWKRIVVSVAGATGNILLAVLLAWLIYGVGQPSAPHERRSVIGYVETETEAWEAGLRTGDTVLAIDGEPVQNWQDLLTVLALRNRDETIWIVRSLDDDDPREVPVSAQSGRMGIRLPEGVHREELCRVRGLVGGGSAEQAGMQMGDLITALDGNHVYSIPHLIRLIQERSGQETPIRVRRGKDELTLTVQPTPDPDDGISRIGILFEPHAVDFDEVTHPKPSAQIREHATVIFRVLRALLTPGESRAAAGSLGGPVLILFYFWVLVRNSFMMAISFTVLLNVNLAILNLLPIPILDGGHILFALYEMIFRRPVTPVVSEWIHRIFAALIIAVALLLVFRDTLRLFF